MNLEERARELNTRLLQRDGSPLEKILAALLAVVADAARVADEIAATAYDERSAAFARKIGDAIKREIGR